jgi:hypothetical protein
MSTIIEAVPRCAIFRPRAGSGLTTPLGVNVTSNGWPSQIPDGYADDAGYLANMRQAYGDAWEPMIEQEISHGWALHEAILVAGGERAGHKPGGRSRCNVSIFERELVGVYVSGLGVQSDGRVIDLESERSWLEFRWPLEDIERVGYDRVKRTFRGLIDVELLIVGSDSTLRVSSVRFPLGEYTQPRAELTPLAAFAEELAEQIAHVRGTAAAWSVENARVAGITGASHTASFAG